MTFIHGYLLGGLVLATAPILVHLIMRQKPRQLPFPAFRFLRQQHLTNQRRLRLQHLLLLLLRMGLIAALCLALAQPRVFTGAMSTGTERPVAAVLVFDTTPSMEYTVGGHTRLDDARQQARELLDEMADGSQVAVLDTGDDSSAEWVPTRELVNARLDGLRIRPAGTPVNRQVESALRLLQQVGEGEDAPPRFVYVFSDRTRGCWDANEAKKIQRPAGVSIVFVDVGVDKPQDLAIDKVEVNPAVVSPGSSVEVRVTLRAVGREYENDLLCQLDGEPEGKRLKQPIRLAAGEKRVFTFTRPAPAAPPGAGQADTPCPLTVRLGSSQDTLPFNNVHYATFLVREKRKVLTVVQDKPEAARNWTDALNAAGAFECVARPLEVCEKLSKDELKAYSVVCLFEVVQPGAALWDKLKGYVEAGGGLVLVPAGEELRGELRTAYNKEALARDLLPATLEEILSVPTDRPGVPWSDFSTRHPLTAPFKEWSRQGYDITRPDLRPAAHRYWRVKPVGQGTIITYQDKDNNPALVERALGKGRVVLFTTPLDDREAAKNVRWNNYWEEWFGLALVDQVCRYLAGDSVVPDVNYLCGQAVQVTLPPGSTASAYTLQGPPGLAAAETTLRATAGEGRLLVPQATAAGNYTVLTTGDRAAAGFSLNVRPEESQLERVPAEEIESVLDKGSVLHVDRKVSLHDALQGLRAPPVELLPYLMMAVLLALTVEGLLANRFYRRAVSRPSA